VYMVTFGRVCCYVITRNNTIIDIQYDWKEMKWKNALK
jgi:hypothetical protein